MAARSKKQFFRTVYFMPSLEAIASLERFELLVGIWAPTPGCLRLLLDHVKKHDFPMFVPFFDSRRSRQAANARNPGLIC